MTRAITDLIDNAVSDWETSSDAMRWAPEPPAPTRRPVARLDGQGCVFVGGPWHGRHQFVPFRGGHLSETYHVLGPPAWPRFWAEADPPGTANSTLNVVTYSLRWYSDNHFGRNWPAYCAPGADDGDLGRALNGPPTTGYPAT